MYLKHFIDLLNDYLLNETSTITSEIPDYNPTNSGI